MAILKAFFYLQVTAAFCASPRFYNETNIQETNGTDFELNYIPGGPIAVYDDSGDPTRPALFAVVEVPSVVYRHVPMVNDTYANVSRADFLLIFRGPKYLPTPIVIPITAVYVLIFLTGVLGNTLVAVVIVKYSNMHSATNFYLCSLAVSDLMLLLLGLPNDLSVYWQQYPWLYGEAVCRLRALASEMSSYCSVLTIVAFSVERYLAVCKPLQAYQLSTLSRAWKIITGIWITSFFFAIPFAFFTDVNFLDFPPGTGRIIQESAFCAMLENNIPDVPIYEVSTFLFFVIPFFILMYLYREILKKMQEQYGQGLGVAQDQVARRQRTRRSVIRMLGSVVICFFMCWAPFHMQRLFYMHFSHSPHYQIINEWLYYVTGCFYYFSSTVNPILYTLMSQRYREAFKKALCWSRFRRLNRHVEVRPRRLTERTSSLRQDTSEEPRRPSDPSEACVAPTQPDGSGQTTVVQITDQNGNTKTRFSESESNGLTSSNKTSPTAAGGSQILVDCEVTNEQLESVKRAAKETYI